MKRYIKIDPRDNVIVAFTDLKEGEEIKIGEESLVLKNDIKMGHKIAIKNIKALDDIIKYGYPIGHATKQIMIGEHVHVNNVTSNLKGLEEYSYAKRLADDLKTEDEKRTFKGYLRKNGEAGIRNELWIIPTVGCVNGMADRMIDKFKSEARDDLENSGIDYVGVFKHNNGCSQMGDDLLATRNILRDMVVHPNAGGVLVLGLGCEYIQMNEFIESLGDYDKGRVRFLVSQEVEDEVEEGVKHLKDLCKIMKDDKRVDISISKLKIGLKCGGSDGLSGLTGNPLLGRFSDYLVSQGGTTVLTEVPEMFGAETILMERAENEEVFNKIVDMINGFKQFCKSCNQPIDENPSPGNKAGGITTLEDKSLGCTQKAGRAVVRDVIKYGEVIKKNGLNLLDSPSNDLVASSAEAAAGCQMVLFTTGRGTPFGSFVPTIKVSTNTALSKKKSNWIDFDAGRAVNGESLDDLSKEFIEEIIEIASGKFSKNEINGFRELAIYTFGVTL